MTIDSLDFSKQYTYADYLEWQFKERLELLRGYIYRMSPAPARQHQKILWNLTGIFYSYFKNESCQAYFAPFDVRLPRKTGLGDKEITTVLQPDLCVICDLTKLDDRGCLGAPDLVVEILSPGNTDKEMKLKYDIYEESGVREYWVVAPTYQMLLPYVLENGKFTGKPPVASHERLMSYIFPELSFSIQDIFE